MADRSATPTSGTTPGRRRTVLLVLAVVALGVLGVSAWRTFGGDEDPYADYCAVVEQERALVGAALEQGAATGLIRALPSFERLADQAPEDLADDWERVISGVEHLERVLDDAGADPATYDRDDPPETVTRAERQEIDAAAAALGEPATSESMKSVQQQALDVCGTPLNL
ncbi:hypothetical protein [Nocardioides sambongensis]|uniref:hypothetical protein n=1 Tax=Nocardioides sambongensis TaxID=2589074 RepID=UPI0015E83910|nr:hypothetical protein [Nocardioides sambongensis]